jgi:hypothetical protein
VHHHRVGRLPATFGKDFRCQLEITPHLVLDGDAQSAFERKPGRHDCSDKDRREKK